MLADPEMLAAGTEKDAQNLAEWRKLDLSRVWEPLRREALVSKQGTQEILKNLELIMGIMGKAVLALAKGEDSNARISLGKQAATSLEALVAGYIDVLEDSDTLAHDLAQRALHSQCLLLWSFLNEEPLPEETEVLVKQQDPQGFRDRCDQCRTPASSNAPLMRCSHCRVMRFCKNECFTKAWKLPKQTCAATAASVVSPCSRTMIKPTHRKHLVGCVVQRHGWGGRHQHLASGLLNCTSKSLAATNPYNASTTFSCTANDTSTIFSVLFFTDGACRTLSLPVVNAVGQCVVAAGGGYSNVSVSGSQVTFRFFSDSACTRSTLSPATVQSGACVVPNPAVPGIGSQIIYAGVAWAVNTPSAACSLTSSNLVSGTVAAFAAVWWARW
ncbi:hypothetical protein DFJ74DRAFT_766997 [Hyaloraphidium curvatum]|nr:hypothetical protein DFJ74DRAFT_766997 [Hyaloraphidium curvatum]